MDSYSCFHSVPITFHICLSLYLIIIFYNIIISICRYVTFDFKQTMVTMVVSATSEDWFNINIQFWESHHGDTWRCWCFLNCYVDIFILNPDPMCTHKFRVRSADLLWCPVISGKLWRLISSQAYLLTMVLKLEIFWIWKKLDTEFEICYIFNGHCIKLYTISFLHPLLNLI